MPAMTTHLTTLLLFAAWFGSQVGPALGQEVEAPTAEESARAQAAIIDLEDEHFERRQAAFQALESLGSKIRPLLESALERAAPESRLRLQTLLERFPAHSEASQVRLEGTRVSLSGGPTTLRELVARLESATDLRFYRPLGVDEGMKVDVDLDSALLLEALDRLGQAAECRWMQDAGSGMIRLMRSQPGSPYLMYEGPLRMALTGISRSSNISFGNEARENCYLQSQIDFEPDAPILGIYLPPTIDRIEDDQGRSLQDDVVINSFMNPTQGRGNFGTSLRLVPWAKDAKEIARLEGKIQIAVASQYDRVIVALPTAETTQTAAIVPRLAVRVVSQTQKPDGGVIFQVEIERETLFADPERRRPIQAEEFAFLTAAGEEIPPQGRPLRQAQGDKETFSLHLPPNVLVDRLLVRNVAALETREIPFRFEGIPLP
ncbi:MAG: hypothetical protein KDB53_05595 [Planctomycetes bacterium]|nr:hypothetical protein [Planctomycetota bacterium]